MFARALLFALLCVGTTTPLSGEWVPDGAWDFREKAVYERPVYGGPLAAFGYLALKYYQNQMHPLRDSKAYCPFYPSCSRFALQSLQLYGPFWGALMTLDRLLIREHQDLEKDYETIEVGADWRFFDPVVKNFIFLRAPRKITFFEDSPGDKSR